MMNEQGTPFATSMIPMASQRHTRKSSRTHRIFQYID